jgi:hypothetical protein
MFFIRREAELTSFAIVNYPEDFNDWKPRSGCVLMLNQGAMSWVNK